MQRVSRSSFLSSALFHFILRTPETARLCLIWLEEQESYIE